MVAIKKYSIVWFDPKKLLLYSVLFPGTFVDNIVVALNNFADFFGNISVAVIANWIIAVFSERGYS